MRSHPIAPRRSISKASSSNGSTPKPSPVPVRNGVAVLEGYNVRVSTDRGRLVLEDGAGQEGRFSRLSRPTSGLKRLIIRGLGGYVSVDALRWLHGVAAGLVVIGHDSEVYAAIGPRGLNDAHLRRAQALAPWNGVGPGIVRNLLLTKLKGQASVLERIPDSSRAIGTIEAAMSEMERAEDVHQMRTIEGKAALAYWRAWEHVTVPWVRRDEPKVPEHWRTFGARMSPLSAKPRYGINPPNAILNYLYSVLEAETTIAARSVGLDPGMGLLHVDDQGRDSLSLDIMEAARPKVDAYLLDLLEGQPFVASVFFETAKGVCRVMPPLSHTLAQTGAMWQATIAAAVEYVAHTLHRAGGDLASVGPQSFRLETASERRAERKPATRLTGAHHIASGAKLRAAASPRACCRCGVVLEKEGRKWRKFCLACTRLGRSETMKEVRAKASARPIAERWGLRAEDVPDPQAFSRDILPKLQDVVLREIARVTGYSIAHASHIRQGKFVPDPRHWPALAVLSRSIPK
jgi:CRISPR-associated endonuclease Cas1